MAGDDATDFDVLRRIFDSPPRDFSPTPLWWWSAERVTTEEIRRQLGRLKDGRVFNVVVINLAPSGPLFGAQVDDPLWFSEDWWDRFTELCDEAERLGMRVWFYDQIGFSGANIQGRLTQKHPWASGKSLEQSEARLDGGRLVGFTAPSERIVGVYALPDSEHPHGARLASDDAGTWQAADQPVHVISWRPTAFDYLDADAVALLMDTVHGEFDRRLGDRLGQVIAGSFQDELPATNSWTDGFAASFAAEFGYDLLDRLPGLFAETADPRVLHDYFTHRTTLTETALFAPLGDWHSARGMLIGSDQLNPARAGWPTQATQVYTDYFRTHRHYGAAGSDHEGDSKVHSSMAHLYGNERVWLESFHSSGWGGTLQDTYDWLLPFLRSGATLYNPHAVYYGTAGGWFEWAPPSTDWRQPYWGQYPLFADTVARITALMSWGRHECSVAVLYPSSTSQSVLALDSYVDHFATGYIGEPFVAADRAQQTYLDLAGTNNWFSTNPGALNDAAIDFDIIDDDSLQRAAIIDGAAAVQDERYRVVLVPSNVYLEGKTAVALVRLLDGGGRVILVGDAPAAVAGSRSDPALIAKLLDHPRLERAADAATAVATIGDGRAIESDLPSLVRAGEDVRIAFIPAASPNATAYPLRQTDSWFWDEFDFDAHRYEDSLSIGLGPDVRWAECWDPATSERRSVPVSPTGHVQVPSHGAPALLLVWGSGERADPAPFPEAPTLTALALEAWTAEVLPGLDNSHGEYDRPATPGPIPHGVWMLDAGESETDEAPTSWASTRATFGPHGEIAPPTELGTPHEFTRWSYSASRGIEKDDTHRGQLGAKGRVPDAFVQTVSGAAGTSSRYRTLVRVPAPGRYELAVGATAQRSVWVDGTLVDPIDPRPFLTRYDIELTSDVFELEYELGADEGAGTFMSPAKPELQGSFFLLALPGELPVYPEYIQPGTPAANRTSMTRFSRRFTLDADAVRARVVVGAPVALDVRIDGAPVGRQEMAEYYETDWSASPQYFVHDLGTPAAGEHLLEVLCESSPATMSLFVDAVFDAADGTRSAVVSDENWQVTREQETLDAVPTRLSWGERANLQLARRPHALPGAEWLTGAPDLGATAVAIETSDSPTPRHQWLRVALPAGVRSARVPTELEFAASVDGSEVEQRRVPGGLELVLPSATAAPAELLLVSAPTVFRRGGAALDGPIELELEPAPTELRPWPELGLGWLSGGVVYRSSIELDDAPSHAILDLGELRGHIKVTVNGEVAGELFCTPWSLEVTDRLRAGHNEVEVELHNTLGPYLNDVSPTWWVFPSHLADGLFGPVTLNVATSNPSTAATNPAATLEQP